MKNNVKGRIKTAVEKWKEKTAVVWKPIQKRISILKDYWKKIYDVIEAPLKKTVWVLNTFSLVFHAIWCMILVLIIEWFSRASFREAWEFAVKSPWAFLYNALILFTTFMIVYLFRRRFFVRLTLSAIWIYLGYMNGTVLSNRVTPFTAQDLKLLDDLADIINKYMTPDKLFQNVAMVVVAIVVLLIFLKKGPKYQGKIHYIRNIIGCILMVVLFSKGTELALENRVLSTYFGNIAFAYEDYGFAYCFGCSILRTGIDKPYNYSEKQVKDIITWEEEVPEEKPNIIFVQLESFFDVSTVEYLECSQDPIPNFHRLMEEYSSGAYKVPSIGAGTANTEFETISGMNMRYFGPGEYPHKTILRKKTCESIPYVLSEIGYTTHAIHNNKATFYSRNEVFPNLGFDTFTSLEYMDTTYKTENGWLEDRVLTDCIMDCLKSSEGSDYIFTISVQGHGDYPREKIIEDPVITVSGSPTPEKDNQWEYYVNQIYEMDQFVADLIAAVEEYGEDTVIVFYGDHLPTMDLTEEDVTNRYLFDTSYVIWDNMGLEKEDETLCAYQIGAEVLDRLGIHKGTLVQYHQERRGTKDYQSDMEVLQYDILYGKKYAYDQEEKFQQKDTKMGIKDGYIAKTVQIDDKVYIFGENFTTQTKVYINDEYMPTAYINDHLIRIKNVTLENGDEVSVRQVVAISSKPVLSVEDTIIYNGNEEE